MHGPVRVTPRLDIVWNVLANSLMTGGTCVGSREENINLRDGAGTVPVCAREGCTGKAARGKAARETSASSCIVIVIIIIKRGQLCKAGRM